MSSTPRPSDLQPRQHRLELATPLRRRASTPARRARGSAGSSASTPAIASRCFWPPDSRWGSRRSSPSSPTAAMARVDATRVSRLAACRGSRARTRRLPRPSWRRSGCRGSGARARRAPERRRRERRRACRCRRRMTVPGRRHAAARSRAARAWTCPSRSHRAPRPARLSRARSATSRSAATGPAWPG